jgi:hypothetical protein
MEEFKNNLGSELFSIVRVHDLGITNHTKNLLRLVGH